MPRIIFGMINNIAKPVGGVKVIYQAAGALRRAGFDAYVLTEKPPPPWLTGNPRAAAAATLDARADGPAADDVDAVALEENELSLLVAPALPLLMMKGYPALVRQALTLIRTPAQRRALELINEYVVGAYQV